MGQNNDYLIQAGVQAAEQAWGMGMGLVLEKHNDARQLRQQEKLQDLQMQGNKAMMDYQQQKQLDMWHATNYGPQMEELKKAGLNPGLIYGMGGGGGATVGSSNASVSGAQAPSGGGEAMGMMQQSMQMGLMDAQRKVLESQANLNTVEAAKKAGADTKLAEAQTASLTQGVENQKAQETLTRTQNRIAEFDADYAGKSLEKRLELLLYTTEKTRQELDIAATQANFNRETYDDKVKIVQKELINLTLRNVLTQAQTENTKTDTKLKDEQIQKTANDILIGWDTLNNQQKQTRIQELLANYNTDVNREVKNDILGVIEAILHKPTVNIGK